MSICQKILGCSFFATMILCSCKKEANKTATTTTITSTPIPPYIAAMEGGHNWVGKRYLLSFDSSGAYYDSSDVIFVNSIHVLSDSFIVVDRTYLFNTGGTLAISFADTASKTVSFTGVRYATGHTYIRQLDSLVYRYSDSTFLWYEEQVESGYDFHAWLHSP